MSCFGLSGDELSYNGLRNSRNFKHESSTPGKSFVNMMHSLLVHVINKALVPVPT
jgi:hypothetical protein